MTHPSGTHRFQSPLRRPTVTVGRLLLLLAFGLVAVACSGDEAATDDAGDSTDVTDPESDDSGDTVQTLDDAAPAEAREPVEDETALLQPGLALDANGLTIVDPDGAATELLAFGDNQDAVIAGMEAVLGEVDQIGEGTGECPNGQATVATWEDTIMVDFDAEGGFLSWLLLPESNLTTAEEVGVGSPVSDLGDQVSFSEQSTLGDEFDAGGYGGLASGTDDGATIERLWAGSVCSFR